MAAVGVLTGAVAGGLAGAAVGTLAGELMGMAAAAEGVGEVPAVVLGWVPPPALVGRELALVGDAWGHARGYTRGMQARAAAGVQGAWQGVGLLHRAQAGRLP